MLTSYNLAVPGGESSSPMIAGDAGRCHLRFANAKVCIIPRNSAPVSDNGFCVT